MIFDNDGTLVDSELVQHTAMSDELRELGIRLSPSALSVKYRGWKLADQVADISKSSENTIDDGLIERFRTRLNRYLAEDLLPTPGIEDALSLLSEPKCVASNAPVQKIRLCLDVTGLTQFFNERYFSAYDVDSWKPEPDLFLHAAASMGFDRDHCIVVEDSVVGVQAAQAAGMRVVAYNPLGLDLPEGGGVLEIAEMAALPAAVARLAR